MGLCQDPSHSPHSTNITPTMAGANEAELREAFKLFDADGDGMISAEELVTLISKVGGQMADAEAKALIHAADKDGNMGIDFSEFAKFWEALHGDDESRVWKVGHRQQWIHHERRDGGSNLVGVSGRQDGGSQESHREAGCGQGWPSVISRVHPGHEVQTVEIRFYLH